MRQYEATDYPVLRDWYLAHRVHVPGFNDFPPIGLVVDGLAAGFLILTDVRMGIFDFFISNPDSDSRDRFHAIEEIIDGLTEIAKERGMRAIRCDTQLPVIVNKALSHGFENLGAYQVFIKEI